MQRATWTDERLDDLAQNIDRRFEQVDRRFAQVDRRFDQVDRRLDRMELRMEALDGSVRQLTTVLIWTAGGTLAAVVGAVAAGLVGG